MSELMSGLMVVASGAAIVVGCTSCSGAMLTTAAIEHHDDGSHTFHPLMPLHAPFHCIEGHPEYVDGCPRCEDAAASPDARHDVPGLDAE